MLIFLGHFKKGHSDKGHKIEKKGSEEEKNTKFFDEDGDEAHDEKKGKTKSINYTIEYRMMCFLHTYCNGKYEYVQL